jgi:phage-related protein (TIGR01555 family)
MFWFKKKEISIKPEPKQPTRAPMRIAPTFAQDETKPSLYDLPSTPPHVIPSKNKMACDAAMEANYSYAAVSSILSEGQGFLGYPYLAELTQRPEYRRISEIIAKEMTRKWIKLTSVGNDDIEDKADIIKAIEDEFKRLKVQEVCLKVLEHDGFFGRGQIYIDTGATDNPTELLTELKDTKQKIGIGSIQRLTPVEAMWTYPNSYNSMDPLKPDYFVPTEWFVMGKRLHASRMIFCTSRKVPDLLKPIYAFGGLSLSQMCKPYIDNWLRTRQSVSDLVHSFSVSGIKTNMADILNGGASDVMQARARLFNQYRDNSGMMMIDKDTEEYFNVSTPLTTLDALQAQAQEHMASVAGIPLAILLKITPSGLNASSEGEIRIFYDFIESEQEANLRPILERILNITQLNLFGEIDKEIGFAFEPLWSMNEIELATARKTEADTDVEYINANVIAPEEVRTRLAKEENSIYAALDLNVEIEPPETDLEDDSEDSPAMDKAFKESEHPRANNGEFGTGGSTAQKKNIKHKTTFTEERSSKGESIKSVFPLAAKPQLQKIGDDLIAGLNGNYDITMTGVKYSKSEQAVEFECAGEDGTHARFHFVKDGETPVKMEFVTLVAGEQKTGIAKKMLFNMLKVAALNNIKIIDTHANMSVGGYVWARAGFVPYQESWDDLRARIIKNNPDIIDKNTLDLLNNPNPKSITDLADSADGKKLLMNTSWYGTFDCSDAESLENAAKYIKNMK